MHDADALLQGIEAFAAAMAKVESAGTFACRQIVTQIGADGEPDLHEMTLMYKEPNLERIEYGEGMPSPGEFMVTDYGKRLRLTARPEEKTASLSDISTLYATDEETGQLKPTELGNHARRDVLRLTAQGFRRRLDAAPWHRPGGTGVEVGEALEHRELVTEGLHGGGI